LVDELDDTATRLRAQVLSQVPEERRRERPGGGNSITWACYHSARHTDLALAVLTGGDVMLPPQSRRGGGGLEEDEQSWAAGMDPATAADYLVEALAGARDYVDSADGSKLERVPETAAILSDVGVPREGYEWLYRMWSDKPAAFLVRWPLTGHVTNHVGEMIATRNRMGLSPF
jgi:hypothetical protein